MNKMKKDRLNKFLNGKGFYIALGICLTAIGLSAWSGYSAVKQKDSTENTSKISSSYSSYLADNGENTSSGELTVDTPKSDVPDDRTSLESTSSQNLSSAAQSKTETPVAKYFLFPVNGDIIKDFSDNELKYSLTYNDMRLHTAIDIAADLKTAVKSSGEGIVTFAGKDEFLGYTVKIDHGNGITAVYGGLAESLTVKEGDTVAAGTNLGMIGVVTAECVDAPHLHLEFYDNEVPVSPLTLISNNQ